MGPDTALVQNAANPSLWLAPLWLTLSSFLWLILLSGCHQSVRAGITCALPCSRPWRPPCIHYGATLHAQNQPSAAPLQGAWEQISSCVFEVFTCLHVLLPNVFLHPIPLSCYIITSHHPVPSQCVARSKLPRPICHLLRATVLCLQIFNRMSCFRPQLLGEVGETDAWAPCTTMLDLSSGPLLTAFVPPAFLRSFLMLLLPVFLPCNHELHSPVVAMPFFSSFLLQLSVVFPNHMWLSAIFHCHFRYLGG